MDKGQFLAEINQLGNTVWQGLDNLLGAIRDGNGTPEQWASMTEEIQWIIGHTIMVTAVSRADGTWDGSADTVMEAISEGIQTELYTVELGD